MTSPDFVIRPVLFLLAVWALPVTGQTQLRIGVCDSEAIIDAHHLSQKFRTASQALGEDFRLNELEKMSRIRDMVSEIEEIRRKMAAAPPADDRLETLRAREFELVQQGIIAERAMRDLKKDYQKKWKKLVAGFGKDTSSIILKEISEYAENHDINFLFDRGGFDESGVPLVLHAAPSTILTPWFRDPGKPDFPAMAGSLKTGLVNMRVLYNTNPGKREVLAKLEDAQKNLASEKSRREIILEGEVQRIRAMIRARKQDPLGDKEQKALSGEETRLIQDVLKQERELEQWETRMERAILEQAAVDSDKLKREILDEVRTFAKSKSYDLIVNKAALGFKKTAAIPGTLDASDLTFEVQEFLDKRRNEGK